MPPITHVYRYACWEVRQLLAEGRQFPPGTPVSSANKTDRHGMTQDFESGVKHQSIQSNPIFFLLTMKNIEKGNKNNAIE